MVLSASLFLGCVAPSLESRREAAAPAISALQKGSFDDAGKLARERIGVDSGDPYGHLVAAVARYKKTMHQLVLDGETVVIGGITAGTLNQKYLQTSFGDAESELASVEADLAVVAEHPGVSMELCIACWEIDWNGNGRVDDRDRLLFQIEQDESGEPIAEDDPRRKPTFRFDDGDIAWARAFVAFERAALDVALAYDWSDAAKIASRHGDMPAKIVVRLVDPGRIEAARARILEGLAQSDASRRAYLAETDDDREWVPNPRQHNHPMPLTADEGLYSTWEGVVTDVRDLVEGRTGLAVADLLVLAEESTKSPPKGYIDIGSMLAHPKDIVIELDKLEYLERHNSNLEAGLTAFFGSYYVRSMKPSPLTGRLMRMKGEIDKHDSEFEHKLRYLLWIN